MTINQRQLAQTISRLENNDPETLAQVSNLPLDSPEVQIIGITGPPGSGKSTLTNRLIQRLSRRDKVAALLIDPSSPYSGGAILGDRIRMSDFGDNVYMRSLSNRGNPGGISRAVVGCLRLLISAGFKFILIETVGAGQSEVKIASVADTTLVVAVPNLGDDIQTAKAGIMEVADIFVLNKSDLAGADRLLVALRDEAGRDKEGWRVPLVSTSAQFDHGCDELVELIQQHGRFLRENRSVLNRRRQQAVIHEVLELATWVFGRSLEQAVMEPAVIKALLSGDFDLVNNLEQKFSSLFGI